MLWGGEPLLSPYFSEITKYLADNEFELGLITNGVSRQLQHNRA